MPWSVQIKSTHPGKKAQKALQPIKKKASHRKKAQKSTTMLLKALATIPEILRSEKLVGEMSSLRLLILLDTDLCCSIAVIEGPIKVVLNECALLARWHRHISSELNGILDMPRYKVMPWQVNHTTVHHTCKSITILKSTCANVSARHSFRKKNSIVHERACVTQTSLSGLRHLFFRCVSDNHPSLGIEWFTPGSHVLYVLGVVVTNTFCVYFCGNFSIRFWRQHVLFFASIAAIVVPIFDFR